MVSLKDHSHKIGNSRCFEPKFSEPNTIVEIKDGITFFVRNANGKIQSVHYDRLVPYAARPLNMDRDIDLSWDISKGVC